MKKNRIVTVLAVSALLTLGIAATSLAAVGDKTVDLGVGFATEPESGIGTGFGFSVGGGYELMEVSEIRGSILQVRGDIGYNSWSKDIDVAKVTLTRIPVSAGARLYVPLEAANNLRVYGEASLELSFDKGKSEVSAAAQAQFNQFGVSIDGSGSSSETNFGLAPAAGVEFAVTPNFNVGASLKYHIVDHGYLNALVGVGYKF